MPFPSIMREAHHANPRRTVAAIIGKKAATDALRLWSSRRGLSFSVDDADTGSGASPVLRVSDWGRFSVYAG